MLMLMNVRMIFVCMEIVLIMMDIFFVCVLWGGLVYIVMLMWMNVLVVYVQEQLFVKIRMGVLYVYVCLGFWVNCVSKILMSVN